MSGKSDMCGKCGGDGWVALQTVSGGGETARGGSRGFVMEEVETLYRCRSDHSHEWWTKRQRVPQSDEGGTGAKFSQAAHLPKRPSPVR